MEDIVGMEGKTLEETIKAVEAKEQGCLFFTPTQYLSPMVNRPQYSSPISPYFSIKKAKNHKKKGQYYVYLYLIWMIKGIGGHI